MPLSKEDVAGIADYARIALSEEELDEMTSYMNEAFATSTAEKSPAATPAAICLAESSSRDTISDHPPHRPR